MKKTLLIFLLSIPFALFSQVTTNPSPIEIDQSITITVDITAATCNTLSSPAKVYAHLGIGDDGDPWGFDVKGNWGMDDGIGEMTDNGNDTWSITITPNVYFNLTAGEEATATKMGMVFRNADGTQKLDFDSGSGCGDFFFNVGAFQVTMINPSASDNGFLVADSGGSTQIIAQNTNGVADYELFANGVSVHTQNNTTFYNGFLFTNLMENQYCDLVVTQGGSSITKSFTIFVNNTVSQAMAGSLVDGINYDDGDTSKATLVLDAPNKDFIYVANSLNNWKPVTADAMKKDPGTGKFWIELTGLTPGTNYMYQYWVGALSPVTDSPKLVKTADPFSTLVLSPFDDPWIPASTYPNLPTYPSGQEREVTVLQTGQTAYPWVVPNFSKPKKEDLIVYEVLVRDFDADRNYQDLIDRIDYFKNLNINAIELMPVMEFEGNESWGYNTSFHMALDKFYGTEDKFKELIDVCHQNGIAVILDLALNHAFGRNPMNRMWMDDPDNDGWGEPSSENPYMNQVATHSFSVGSDYDHSQSITQNYVERVIKHWIEEFKIDGFRWDLTKGFTQNCTSGDDACTGSYQQDRVDILKAYADYSWSLDPDHYVIFEHLGGDTEEQEWANYRLGEGKGIMMWSKMTDPYNELTMGQNGNKNFDRMGHTSHGFTGKRVMGYAESHDEERLMYKNLAFGNSFGGYDVKDLNTALNRMSALGAVTLTIPGPKMIWHFGELGMENSIFTCNDGGFDDDGCKLDTKPQPQWESAENWPADPNRSQIYSDWARLNELKINEDVFEGNYSIDSGSLTPRIFIWDNALPNLKNVVILANFDVTTQNVTPDFPYTGNWYDLMDNTGSTSINVSNTTTPISIPAGEFRIYGNQGVTLSTDDFISDLDLIVYPNPVTNTFSINKSVGELKVFDLSGKLVKEFKGNFTKGNSFDISNLARSLYILKITNSSGEQQATKLVKL